MNSMSKISIIESPFSGDQVLNIQYARRAMRDSIQRGEIPYASHLLYTQVLNDDEPTERALGMAIGQQMLRIIAAGVFSNSTFGAVCAVYDDLGLSPGMKQGIEWAAKHGIQIEFRQVPEWPNAMTAPATNVVHLKTEVTNG
jgi:hypothetical protein